MKKHIIILLVLITSLMACSQIKTNEPKTPEAVIQSAFNEFVNENYENYLDYFVNENGKLLKETKEKYLKLLNEGKTDLSEEMAEHGKLEKLNIIEIENKDEDHLVARIKMVLEDGYSSEENLELVKFEDQWYLWAGR